MTDRRFRVGDSSSFFSLGPGARPVRRGVGCFPLGGGSCLPDVVSKLVPKLITNDGSAGNKNCVSFVKLNFCVSFEKLTILSTTMVEL